MLVFNNHMTEIKVVSVFVFMGQFALNFLQFKNCYFEIVSLKLCTFYTYKVSTYYMLQEDNAF